MKITIPAGRTLEKDVVLNEGLELQEIVVGGAFQGQRRAINSQKNSLGITNVVSADQVGKFPDSNIGDALKRISGINVQYNLQTDSLYSASSPQKITPYGEWIISGEYLIGKEVIIIPQTILSGTNSVSVKLGSNIFSGSIPDTKLISGKSEELIITCNQSRHNKTN